MNTTNLKLLIDDLNNQSIALMQYQPAAYTLWVVLGLVDAFISILTIAIIIVWKPLHTDTQVLVAHLSASEALSGISYCCTGCYHLFNIVKGYPETTTQANCYQYIFTHIFSRILSAFYYFGISIDCFFAVIFPMFYKKRSKKYAIYSSIVYWSVTIVLFTWSCFSASSQIYIPICIVRSALSDSYYRMYNKLLIVLYTVTVSVYCLIAVIMKYQIMILGHNHVNVTELRKRIRSKVMVILALIAVVHFVIYNGGSLVSLYLSTLPNRGTIYSPYIGSSYFVGGILSSFTYLVRQKDFYDGFIHFVKLVKVKLSSCQVCVTNSITPSIAIHTVS